MREPQPNKINHSLLKNRLTRVGIVLLEDDCVELKLTPKDIILVSGRGNKIPSGQTIELKANSSDEIEVLLNGESLYSSHKVIFTPEIQSQELHGTQGTIISPIIAGRTFHWRKEIEATFPGALEFIATDGKIIGVNSLPFEQYLACVVVSEMSSSVPEEFVKAQVIAARSWAACFKGEKHPDQPFDLCNDDDCQRYHGVTFASDEALSAALATTGEYLVYKDNVLPGYYSKSCGGYTEDPEDCFGFPVPGLRAVPDGETDIDPRDLDKWLNLSEEEASKLHCSGHHITEEQKASFLGGVDVDTKHFRWAYEIKKEQIRDYLRERASLTNISEFVSFTPKKYGASGRIHEADFTYTDDNGSEQIYTAKSQYELRQLLHESFLYSTAFKFNDTGDALEMTGAGWGHGVGLCQMGAAFQALRGRDYREILDTYFPDADIKKCY